MAARYCDAHEVAVTLASTCPGMTAADAGFASPSIVRVDRRGSTSTWDIYTCQLPADLSVVVQNTVSTVTLNNNEHTFDYDCSGRKRPTAIWYCNDVVFTVLSFSVKMMVK